MAAPLRYQRSMSDGSSDPPTPGSRSSVATAPSMPSIAEDEVGGSPTPTPRAHRSHRSHPPPQPVIWPRTPLRVPQKGAPRRPVSAAQAPNRVPSRGPVPYRVPVPTSGVHPNWAYNPRSSVAVPPRAVTRGPPSRTTTPAVKTAASTPQDLPAGPTIAISPPPYVPVTYLPPRYGGSDADSHYEDLKRSYSSAGSRSRWYRDNDEKSPEKYLDSSSDGSSTRGHELEPRERRWRWLMIIGLVLLGIGIAASLAVGLTFGIPRQGGDSSSSSSNDEASGPIFPAGSYTFNTILQRTSSSCTSSASTWQCDASGRGENATFLWIIQGSESSSFPYTVSSSENAFGPSFSNLTAAVFDANGPSERLVFEFDMDKTVTPSHDNDGNDALASRAAKCTYTGTRFQATLWTKRGGDGDVTDEGDDGFGAWPADVEIVQSKKSEIGQPECQDDQGNAIADVQAAAGECVCDYTNYTVD